MLSDIEIAKNAKIFSILNIAHKIGLTKNNIELYGEYKAKIKLNTLKNLQNKNKKGKLILVTSINPTPFGEGKSTIAIGLADALSNYLNKKTILTMREPSLGPVMGLKGGATGGGYSQVIPMEDINLYFTGDINALTSANNTLAALIDNHIQHGNRLNIDPRKILWKRCLDVNDRSLRNIIIGLGSPLNGIPRQDEFQITAASELMSILCLSNNLMDLKNRISNILVGFTYDNKPVYVNDLGVSGAITLLLKNAINPNLVQTLEHTPTIIHGGPFANIAHGSSSILSIKTALYLSDYTVTEAGFGSDLGAEKFLDIVTPYLDTSPSTVVIVVTVRALKYNSGVKINELNNHNIKALKKGFANLRRHILNIKGYGLPSVVSINCFKDDFIDEINCLKKMCDQLNVPAVITNVWEKGGLGGVELANKVIAESNKVHKFHPVYKLNMSLEDKIFQVVNKIYGGEGVDYSDKALKSIQIIKQNGWDKLPICIAKTPYSFSDNKKLLGAPSNFKIHVQDIEPKLGAGFLVILTENILTMPGLPTEPAALKMDIDEDGNISGLI